MLRVVKRVARRILPRSVIDKLRGGRHVDEVAMIAGLCAGSRGVMVDVGAHIGTNTRRFLDLGWSVLAYEPDPKNRAEFERNIRSPNAQLSPCAVGDEERSGVQLFASDISTGISGLSAFHPSHKPTATVDVVTLREDLSRRGVGHVDFLKIDVEGFDYFVLKGHDWQIRPRFVLYEFENRKTKLLGYSLAESSAYLQEKGYTLLFSVWEPIVEYGRRHTWRGLYRHSPRDAAACWGNVLAFADSSDADECLRRFGAV